MTYENRVSTPEERRTMVQNETQAFFAALRDGWVPEEDLMVPCGACEGKLDIECKKCGGDGELSCSVCDNNEDQLDLFAHEARECVDHVISETFVDCDACNGEGTIVCAMCAGLGEVTSRPPNHPADEWTIAALNKIPVGAPAILGPTPDWLKKERAKQKAKETRIRNATRAIAR